VSSVIGLRVPGPPRASSLNAIPRIGYRRGEDVVAARCATLRDLQNGAQHQVHSTALRNVLHTSFNISRQRADIVSSGTTETGINPHDTHPHLLKEFSSSRLAYRLLCASCHNRSQQA